MLTRLRLAALTAQRPARQLTSQPAHNRVRERRVLRRWTWEGALIFVKLFGTVARASELGGLVILLVFTSCAAWEVGAAEGLFSAPHVQKNVSENDRALFSGDVDTVINFTNPRMIEIMGGREAARKQIAESLMGPIKATNMELISLTFPQPPVFLNGGGNHFVVVPTLSVVRFPKTENKIESLNFYVGILDTTSQSWKYLDGSRINEQSRIMFLPGFPPDFKLPQIYRKKF